jgi:site-specific recombinase XerD
MIPYQPPFVFTAPSEEIEHPRFLVLLLDIDFLKGRNHAPWLDLNEPIRLLNRRHRMNLRNVISMSEISTAVVEVSYCVPRRHSLCSHLLPRGIQNREVPTKLVLVSLASLS